MADLPSYYRKSLAALAKSELSISLIAALKYGGSGTGLLAPAIMAWCSWPTGPSWPLWTAYLAGLTGSVVGPMLNQGATYLETDVRDGADKNHNKDVTAALRMLRDVRGGAFDPRRYQDHVLIKVVRGVHRVRPGAPDSVIASLWVRDGDELRMVARSDHHDGRQPTAVVKLDDKMGVAQAYNAKATVHIQDVAKLTGGLALAPKSQLYLPLLVADADPCGVLAISAAQPDHFTARLDEIVSNLAPFAELLAFSVEWPKDRP